MRCFIAIDIEEKIRKALGDIQKQLIEKTDLRKGEVKWVKPDNIHLTLKFMADINDEQVAEVGEIAKQVASAHKSFDIDVESVGTFGGGRSIKVVWAGIGKGVDELKALQKDLESQLVQMDYPPEEREFSAHLTLCRVVSQRAGFKLVETAKQLENFKLGTVNANALCFYQSQLTPQGPVYTLLDSFKLMQK
jgi:RNA 2',3'-cyclic 3'-phosphodiesterase